jgi:hypothetical protein
VTWTFSPVFSTNKPDRHHMTEMKNKYPQSFQLKKLIACGLINAISYQCCIKFLLKKVTVTHAYLFHIFSHMFKEASSVTVVLDTALCDKVCP